MVAVDSQSRVFQIATNLSEAGMGLDTFQPGQLQIHIVVVIDVVDADDFVAALQ